MIGLDERLDVFRSVLSIVELPPCDAGLSDAVTMDSESFSPSASDLFRIICLPDQHQLPPPLPQQQVLTHLLKFLRSQQPTPPMSEEDQSHPKPNM